MDRIEITTAGTDGTSTTITLDHTNTESAEAGKIKMPGTPKAYRYLLGKIVAEYGQQKAFAAALGITKEELSNKMTGKTSWTKKNIRKACELLNISREDVGLYFFPEIPTAAERQTQN